jgi:pimeloyl-ACP methyl ester carboxylesterase
MSLNEALLERHRTFREPGAGFAETFVELEVGPDRTIGVLSEPLAEAHDVGWLICPPFGNEQVDLYHSEVAVARGLAGAGYRVLRFHAQGYGDAADLTSVPGPGSQLRDTLDVLEQFRARWGVERVGLLGCRFGGTIAAKAAEVERVTHLALIHPVLDGGRYLNELLRAQIIAQVVLEEKTTAEELLATMERDGWVNLQGWALHRSVAAELREMRLDRVERSAAAVLLVQVSRTMEPNRSLQGLAGHLRELGSLVAVEVAADPAASHFGHEHFVPQDHGSLLADSLEAINAALPSIIGRWVAEG